MGSQQSNQRMESKAKEVCQQCLFPFSQSCKRRVYCSIHNGSCFECQKCVYKNQKIMNDIVPCSICARLISIEEAYLDIFCDAYICKNQFVNLELKSETIQLPCGNQRHQEQRKHIINFMSGFCYSCGRKMNQVSSQTINKCSICKSRNPSVPKIDFALPTTLIPETKNPISIQQNSIENEEKIKDQTQETLPKIPYKQDQVAIIQILKKDLESIQIQLTVSQFSRIKLKKLIGDRGKDVECPFCLQPFDLLNKKPMMICMQQHLLCQECVKSSIGKTSKCLVCQDTIQLEKASICRREVKLIEIEQRSKLSYKQTHEQLIKASLVFEEMKILEAKVQERRSKYDELIDADKKKQELQSKMQSYEKEQEIKEMQAEEKGKKTTRSNANRKAEGKSEPKPQPKTKQIKKQPKKYK